MAKLSAATGVEPDPPCLAAVGGVESLVGGEAAKANAEEKPPLRCGVVMGDIVRCCASGVFARAAAALLCLG